MTVSEQMASSFLFTDMRGSEKESNLIYRKHHTSGKGKEQVVCIPLPHLFTQNVRETAETELPIGSVGSCHEVIIIY